MKGARLGKSLLGAIAAALYVAAFATAYCEYVSASGQWPQGGWIFLAAMPYTVTMIRLTGSVEFSGDAIQTVVIAAAFGGVVAYVAGALIEAVARMVLFGARKIIRAA